MEEVYTKLYIDEEREPHILNRLYREGRNGEVMKMHESRFPYAGTFFSIDEILPWVKASTDRIMDIQGTDTFSMARVTQDWEKIYEIYCGNKEQGTMELFYKMYSCYYNMVRHILNEVNHSPITRQDMEDIYRTYDFQESAPPVIPKLADSTQTPLEEQDKHTFTSRLGHATPTFPLMNLQKAWLKSLIQDSRFQLFFTDRQLELLAEEQDGLPSFYHEDDFCYYDHYKDGGSCDSLSYEKHFQTILRAIREEHAFLVTYRGKHNCVRSLEIAPYQLQCSSRGDKFRFCYLQLHRNMFSRSTILNPTRMKDCHVTSKSCLLGPESHCLKPI